MSYQIKDNGTRQDFPTGARRDTNGGKGRFDLLPPDILRREADHYEGGARKYGDRNWQKGIPLSRYVDSAMRHLNAWREGARDEDHLIAARWNLGCLAWTVARIEEGRLPLHLDDAGLLTPAEVESAVANGAEVPEGWVHSWAAPPKPPGDTPLASTDERYRGILSESLDRIALMEALGCPTLAKSYLAAKGGR